MLLCALNDAESRRRERGFVARAMHCDEEMKRIDSNNPYTEERETQRQQDADRQTDTRTAGQTDSLLARRSLIAVSASHLMKFFSGSGRHNKWPQYW